MSILKCNNLEKKYDTKKIVHDISLEVNSGEVIGLLGPNGAGKTTTFYMIVGLIKSDFGSILIDDIDITSIPIHKRFEYGISYLPQEPSIFRNMTALDNIKAILETDNKLSKQEKQRIQGCFNIQNNESNNKFSVFEAESESPYDMDINANDVHFENYSLI